MGNCCFKLPIPTNNNGFDILDDENANKDWLVLDHDTGDGLLTMILTLEENSDLAKTQTFVETNSNLLKNILFSKPRRSGTQPNWSSLGVTKLFQSIGRLPHLEVLLLHEVGTSSNPIPIHGLQHIVNSVHAKLKQTYLVGHFIGDAKECTRFAESLQQQPQLQSFALYGNGSREFTLDPILKAVSQLDTLKYLYFHGNMPNPLGADTIQLVGNMAHLETLTIHSCDTNGHNLSALAKCFEKSKCLQELTVFEAFEMFQAEAESSTLTSSSSCATALCKLLLHSPSLCKVQIWFGFCTDSTVLQQFAAALAQNPRITSFETALLWTDYDDDTAQVFLDMLRGNAHLTKLQLCGYKGCWRLPLWFYTRLNQTGRRHHDPHQATDAEWLDLVTSVPIPAWGEPTPAVLEDAPLNDPDWFELSWRYYYLRLQPSLMMPPPERNCAAESMATTTSTRTTISVL